MGSLVQFAGNIGMMMRKFGGFLSGVYIFRFLKWLYLKLKKFLFWLFGKQPSTKEQFEEMFANAVDATNEANKNGNGNQTNPTHYSWLSIGFYCFGIMYIIQWIYKSISNELDQKKKMEQQMQLQQQQQNGYQPQQMMNPYGGFGQMNPYGGGMYGGYGGGMYGAGMPMMTQPQPPMQTQQPQNNQNKDMENGS